MSHVPIPFLTSNYLDQNIQTYRQIYRTEKHTDKHTDKPTEQTKILTNIQNGRTYRQTYRTDKLTDNHTEQTNIQTNIQNRQSYRHTYRTDKQTSLCLSKVFAVSLALKGNLQQLCDHSRLKLFQHYKYNKFIESVR